MRIECEWLAGLALGFAVQAEEAQLYVFVLCFCVCLDWKGWRMKPLWGAR